MRITKSRLGLLEPGILFNTYLRAVAQECNDLTVPDWTGRVAGADVFTSHHTLLTVLGDS